MPRRFEGWEGIIHGGILCTILDEVMAWALVEQRQLGRHRPHEHRLPQARDRRPGDPRRGWITESRRRIQVTAGRIVDADRAELATAVATYVAASDARKRELKERYGVGGERFGMSPAARPPPSPRPPTDSWPAHLVEATALGERLADVVHDPGRPSSPPSRAASPNSRIRSTSTGSGRSLPASGPSSACGCRLMEAAHKAFKRGTRQTPTSLLDDAMDRLLARRRARSAGSGCGTWSGSCPRTRADLAADAPRGPRSGRVDHRRHAGPPVRRRHPARPAPLGGARAARLLAVALGAAPRRLHDGHAAARPRRRRRRTSPVVVERGLALAAS
jgi:hypothetical protein